MFRPKGELGPAETVVEESKFYSKKEHIGDSDYASRPNVVRITERQRRLQTRTLQVRSPRPRMTTKTPSWRLIQKMNVDKTESATADAIQGVPTEQAVAEEPPPTHT
jgi:hypothetical protein